MTAERDEVRGLRNALTSGVTDADDAIREITTETTRLEDRLADLEVDLINDYLLNAPMLDFIAPSLVVHQTITENIVDDVNFKRVRKMDRCLDLPSGHRSGGVRGLSAALPDASEPRGLRRERVTAHGGVDRLHGLP